MTKIQMIQTIGVPGIAIMILFVSLGHLIFEIVSNFEIRFSNFANARTAIMPFGFIQKPGPLDPDFYYFEIGSSVFC
jgi:hypothetical protein